MLEWSKGIFGHICKGDPTHHEHYDRDWEIRPLAINRTPDGIISIASVPSGKGIDVIWGMRFCVNLYPDGRYFIESLPSWVMQDKGRRNQEGRPNMNVRDGCKLYPSCFQCPEKDCVQYV